jgi:hypothetical protein
MTIRFEKLKARLLANPKVKAEYDALAPGVRDGRRRSFATAELSDERVQAIGASRMDRRHAHLDAKLKAK